MPQSATRESETTEPTEEEGEEAKPEEADLGSLFQELVDTIEEEFKTANPLTVLVVFALGVHAFITLPVLLRYVGKVKPFKTMAGASPAMLTAFSTASPRPAMSKEDLSIMATERIEASGLALS